MKIVVITDIEDLITAKIEIDKYLIEQGQQESKMSLEDYMNKYAITNMIYLDHGKNIPFNLIKFNDDNIYLFFTEQVEDKLVKIIEDCNYDISSLKEISIEKIIEDHQELENVELIIVNNKYYKIESDF